MIKKIHKDSFDGFLRFKSLKKFYRITGRKKHVQTAEKNNVKLKKLIKKKSKFYYIWIDKVKKSFF